MYESIFEKAYAKIKNNDDLELVEIVSSSIVGTPRKEGAFMFVDEQGISFGSVGGGMVEYLATQYAKELLLKKVDGEKEYDLSQKKAENIGMVCGGICNMKFYYLTNNEKSFKILDNLKEKNKNKVRVVIFGGGHISVELSKLLKYVGFDYIVWDDREDFANSERFPGALRVICKNYENVLSEVSIKETDMVVIMTRGHASDYEVEKQILKTSVSYIGVIGSKNKNKVIREKLISDGFSEMLLDSVHAPIGINIGAESIEEIVISIIAELIYTRAKNENRSKLMKDDKGESICW